MEIFIETYTADIAWIIILLIFAMFGLKRVVSRFVKLADDDNDEERSMLEKRAETLGKVAVATGKVIIYSLVLLMLLDMFGIDIRPILTGAGIIGLAVGFGAQSLVKDVVSGLFVLVENQYGVGDKVKLGNAEGVVKRISMRSTLLVADDGEHIYIGNGAVSAKEVINYSRKKK